MSSFYIYETSSEKKGDVEMTETNKEAIQILKDYKEGVWIQTHVLERSLQTVIEQAERAQELEVELKVTDGGLEMACDDVIRLRSESKQAFARSESKHLREALEFYADKKKYVRDVYNESIMDDDDGFLARRALEGVSNDQTIKT